jgi:hypothetical protein
VCKIQQQQGQQKQPELFYVTCQIKTLPAMILGCAVVSLVLLV